MKITDFKTFVIGNSPPGFGGKYFVFVKLITDDGTTGIGEVYSVPFNPHVVARMIEDVCERLVVGNDPFKIEQLWRRAYGSGFTQRPDISMMGVLSGIEMAYWDIVGKAVDKPVYELLGGRSMTGCAAILISIPIQVMARWPSRRGGSTATPISPPNGQPNASPRDLRP
jgi:galactonate dehydratase